jgi:putative transposase
MDRYRSCAAIRSVLHLAWDLLQLASAAVRSHSQLAAENLFLRKQLALYVERQVKPRRADDPTRIALVALSWLIDWRHVLIVVKPATLIRWHRKGFRLFWRWKSKRRGRPRLPADLRRLIVEMASANRIWGEERIASELLLKLGIRVSPRTVRRYMPTGVPRNGTRSQLWSTFVRNHASGILACDFFVAITATFRVFYIFIVLEVGTRRIRHWNVTEYPTADWTAQQFRMVMSDDQQHRFLIHDHDSIYSAGVDRTIAAMGLTILRTPVRSPQANAFCERLIGTIRRQCLDWMILLNEGHLRRILQQWVAHYNRGRPHTSLGPGIPDGPRIAASLCGHRICGGHRVVADPILGGLHHEYHLEPRVA